MYLGAERLVIANHSVSLTEVTESELCGAITADTEGTGLPPDGALGISGPFVVDRV